MYKTRSFSGPSHQKLSNFLETQSIDDNKNVNDYYQIIHNLFLLELMKQTICVSCKVMWNGDMSISKREGANFVGIGHQGLTKLCAILNLPTPIDEDHFSETIEYLLPIFESHKSLSMQNAIEETCKKSNGCKITVSGDGTWQTRGFSSLHGIVDILSTVPTAKVLDIERLSKKCSICTGLLSIKNSNPNKYMEIKNTHQCEINHFASSASMEVDGIYRLFSRSERLYNVQYTHYIGDGDAKVFPKLSNDPPYKDISIVKIEDVNH
ncbi:unnamed protein product [Rotaria sp. Silwood2]|nr:unnamed protein product [Rotaria sp. Silwood2]